MEIEKFRFPGEFEPQTDVFINWLPDYCAGEDGDKGREVLVEVVKNLLGHVNVHVNCGCETSLEACKQMLADAGVDVSDPDTEGQRNPAADNGDEKFSPFIRFTQFDDWSVSIRDNGPGVRACDLPYVFETGFTGDSGHEKNKATGMGLYLAREVAKDLGLTLTAASDWGAGFAVRVTFPVVEE